MVGINLWILSRILEPNVFVLIFADNFNLQLMQRHEIHENKRAMKDNDFTVKLRK